MAVKQTAGRKELGEFAPKFAELNDDVSILNSLDVLANSVSDFIDDTESRDEFNTNDYRYYISDSMRNALDAIENTIVKLDGRQIFTDNHVYTYEDILDSIYQQTDGRNDVIKYYETLPIKRKEETDLELIVQILTFSEEIEKLKVRTAKSDRSIL